MIRAATKDFAFVPRPRAARTPLAATLATALTLAAVALVYLISAKVLQWAGLPYASSGGSALAKFHPATFVALAALALWAVAIGPSRLLARIALERPGLIVFAFAIALLTYQASAVQNLPLSAIADTFVLPLALFISIAALPLPIAERLMLALHALFLLNSTIGYFEYFTGLRLTPFYDDGKILTYEWRATALLGHPLSNAMLTGIYLLILTGPGGRRFPLPLRGFLLVYNLGAMTAFGGRAATVSLLAILALKAGLVGLGILAGRRFSMRSMVGVLVAVMLVGLLGMFMVQSGFFDSFIGRFQDDSGSAATRVAMFHVFDGTSWHDFIFAPDLDHIGANQHRLGLAIAIESFVVAFFAYYGVITTVLFFAGLIAFVAEILRLVGPAGLLPLGYYFAVSSTSTGIANKTIDFALVTAMVLILLDRRFIAAVMPQRAPAGAGHLLPC
ncbi:VpsF family polysaccharide biosynthesis protein [Kaistia dalseonensis]|uniref:Uncharacterized protein n=1 Tax=Kaistia dalseonensis TaxID=410840 RepID=A0ABU0H8D5_9HYPH|nr:VpsF family polysaccharide biosynthesis protein [Kaistia dalseonensis]MCX5495974.1 VpsF family polysaccharide biosynthesis protein [Kaistia dalseonensis]MDQ0438577.1 hypothetical protein [Kaistia dalseonensis]